MKTSRRQEERRNFSVTEPKGDGLNVFVQLMTKCSICSILNIDLGVGYNAKDFRFRCMNV